MKRFYFPVLVLFFGQQLFGQIRLPENNDHAGWQKSKQAQKFPKAALFNHIDGGAEIFLEFGFEELTVQDYKKVNELISLELYKMDSPTSALGIYLLKCGRETPICGVSARNSGNRFQLTMVKGSYFIQINNFSGNNNNLSDMAKFAQLLTSAIVEKEEPILLFEYLPPKNLVPGSEKIIRGKYGLEPLYTFGSDDILSLNGKVFAIVADYQSDDHSAFTRIFIPYPDLQYAENAFKKLVANIDPYIHIIEHRDDYFIFQDYQNKFGFVNLNKNLMIIKIHLSERPQPETLNENNNQF